MMFSLLQHLELLNLSMATLSIGTGLMLGTFVGQLLPLQSDDSQWQG